MHLFKEFIRIMGKSPTAIITDQQISIKQALDALKVQGVFTGNHILDTFHIMRNQRKRSPRNLIGYYGRMCKARTIYEYETAKQELLVDGQENPESVDRYDAAK
jgi:hypothetical protein